VSTDSAASQPILAGPTIIGTCLGALCLGILAVVSVMLGSAMLFIIGYGGSTVCLVFCAGAASPPEPGQRPSIAAARGSLVFVAAGVAALLNGYLIEATAALAVALVFSAFIEGQRASHLNSTKGTTT
jgi:hypothetical protein